MKEKKTKIIIGTVVGILLLLALIFLLIKGCVKEYTVTFDSNGGSSVESIRVKENEKLTKPKDPTKTGYHFKGWYYNEELFDFDTKITKDLTLIAYWDANGIELESYQLSLLVGATKKLEILSLPEGITAKDLIFKTSDESILTIDQNGNIKALKEGKITVTINTKDGKYSTTCEIIITKEKIEVESLSITGSSTITVGSSIKLEVTLNPSNATNDKLTWTSSDPSIATVDENGRVKGIKEGTVTITVKTENGKTATKTITIKNAQKPNGGNNQPTTPPSNPTTPSTVAVSGVEISGGNSTMTVGDTGKLTATVTPTNATNKKVKWSTSNNNIVSIDQDGNIKATGKGEATITVTTEDGNKTATFKITVKEKESRYELHLTKIKMEGLDGVTYQYQFRITKDGASFTDYKGFTLNGTNYLKTSTSSTVASTDVKNSNTATIGLVDGSTKTLYVMID